MPSSSIKEHLYIKRQVYCDSHAPLKNACIAALVTTLQLHKSNLYLVIQRTSISSTLIYSDKFSLMPSPSGYLHQIYYYRHNRLDCYGMQHKYIKWKILLYLSATLQFTFTTVFSAIECQSIFKELSFALRLILSIRTVTL